MKNKSKWLPGTYTSGSIGLKTPLVLILFPSKSCKEVNLVRDLSHCIL